MVLFGSAHARTRGAVHAPRRAGVHARRPSADQRFLGGLGGGVPPPLARGDVTAAVGAEATGSAVPLTLAADSVTSTVSPRSELLSV